MVMINKHFLLGCVMMLAALFSDAQVKFSGNPAVIGRNADALLSVNAISSYQAPVSGTVSIIVMEERSGMQVVSVSFAKALLEPGNNNLARFRTQSDIIFYENGISQVLKNTGTFGPGEYQICCQFDPLDKSLPGFNNQQCFTNLVLPKFPLVLIHPVDSICDFRPAFTWSGRKAQGTAYKIICSEVNPGQSPGEALQDNVLFINQTVWQQSNQLAFPTGATSLKSGKTYAWQVVEMTGANIVNNSEIYQFTVGCKTTAETSPESFAEVKPEYTGRRYYFTRSVNFSFTNPYAPKKLEYAIINVATRTKLTNLPELKMSNGLNKMVLSTEDLKGLQKNEEYKVEIYNLSPATHYFNFIIKE
jgi:hypothetical protein